MQSSCPIRRRAIAASHPMAHGIRATRVGSSSVNLAMPLERIDTLVVDKTGTVTQGRPEVVAVVPVAAFGEAEVLRLAAGLERRR